MDFMNRGGRPVQQNTQTQTHSPAGAPSSAKPPTQKTKFKDKSILVRIAYVVLLLAVTAVVVALIAFLASSSVKTEQDSVNKNQYQAVFLNGGQVYFGKVGQLNSQYLEMGDIYYLRVNQQVQPDQQQSASANDISLVKLGCELHGPEDSMVINREQIIFWENLKDSGQVAKAIAEYKKQPANNDCQQQSGSSTPSSSSNTTNNATTNNSSTTGSGTTNNSTGTSTTPSTTTPSTTPNNSTRR